MERKELVERRRYKRFRVQEGAFAVFGSHASEVGQIRDIAGAGMRFIIRAFKTG